MKQKERYLRNWEVHVMNNQNSQIGDALEEIRELLDIEQPRGNQIDNSIDHAWYVGATGYNSEGVYSDFAELYISEGRWENGWDTKFVDEVKQIQVGDRIALKSSYTKKKGLPFNNNGKTVGVMGIKAIGVVTENPGDGKNLKVNWTKFEQIKEWYGLGVLRATLHHICAADGLIKSLLLKFTFEGINQDYSMCEEQYKENDLNEISKAVICESGKDYSLEELGAILEQMYNAPDVNKTTAIHMFGLKYGDVIKKNNYTATSIVNAAHISPSYHVEVSKGISIYESILSNEYGVAFYSGETIEKEIDKKKLPRRTPRVSKIHPLNCILYGAPGTGKTYNTAEYALAIVEGREVDLSEKSPAEREEVMQKYNSLIETGQVVFTTFHQSYGYEEFIQGLRPDTKEKGLAFKEIDGVFKKIAEKAIKDNENNYVIIIDEINRANISKVFGELITLLEEDKRWGEVNETSATLQSGELFAVPNNLYIVGTMNSSDKSISLIDAALRRRFIFIEQKPNSKLIKNDVLRQVFEKLNERLVNELDSTDLLVGHSYFIGKNEEDLEAIFNNSIIPLLYEYFYDNRKKIASVLDDVLKTTNLSVVNEKMGRLRVCVKDDA